MTKREEEDEQIWKYYQLLLEYPNQELSRSEFCKKHKLDTLKFANFKMHFFHKSVIDPELYARLVPIGRAYLENDIPLHEFAKQQGVRPSIVAGLRTHLNFVDRIEAIRQKKEVGMNFIKIPAIPARPPAEYHPVAVQQEAEVVEARNCVELIIQKGVKVIVAPEVGADKLIKIIELLKDL